MATATMPTLPGPTRAASAAARTSWCRRCRANRTFTGPTRATSGGMLRARGHCPDCRGPLAAIVGKATGGAR